MKIEEKAPVQGSTQENNTPVTDKPPTQSAKQTSSDGKQTDFKSYMELLDDNKKSVQQQQVPTDALTPDKKAELLKTLKKFDLLDNIPINVCNISEIRQFFMMQDVSQKGDDHTKINLNSLKKEDVSLLKTCLENPSVTFNPQNLQANIAIQAPNGQISYKSIGVSKTLFNLIEYSFKAQKPVRLDFEGDSSVILKMNNDGRLIAQFISNDKAMEYAIKSGIPALRDKLDSEGVPYDKIYYRDNSQNSNKREKKGGS